jgi:mRNA interferase MazF
MKMMLWRWRARYQGRPSMMRGEVWVARADLYASKVRPVLIVQADSLCDAYASTIACLLTTTYNSHDIARVRIVPDRQNGLKEISFVMTDKVFSFDRADLEVKIGELSADDMRRVSDTLRSVLGL